jgi:prepilin-type N-terminal cleavage/methylation domain-containing protein
MREQRRCGSRRDGVTLVELLVVIVILGVMAGVAGLTFRTARVKPSSSEEALGRIAMARRQAIATGHDVSLSVQIDTGLHAVTAHPDGRVLADSLPALDPLSGRRTITESTDAPR